MAVRPNDTKDAFASSAALALVAISSAVSPASTRIVGASPVRPATVNSSAPSVVPEKVSVSI